MQTIPRFDSTMEMQCVLLSSNSVLALLWSGQAGHMIDFLPLSPPGRFIFGIGMDALGRPIFWPVQPSNSLYRLCGQRASTVKMKELAKTSATIYFSAPQSTNLRPTQYEFKSSMTVPTLSLFLPKYSVLLAFPTLGLAHFRETSNYLTTVGTRAMVNAPIKGLLFLLLFSFFLEELLTCIQVVPRKGPSWTRTT